MNRLYRDESVRHRYDKHAEKAMKGKRNIRCCEKTA